MLSGFAKLLLISTSIAPVLATYAWVAYRGGDLSAAAWLLIICAALVAACIQVLKFAQRTLERASFRPTAVEAADRENVAFLLIYLLPLLSTSYEQIDWTVLVPVVATFAAVQATGYSYHFNPLLGFWGWHFYRVTSPEGVVFVLITKKQMKSAATELTVGQLTEYIILDLEASR